MPRCLLTVVSNGFKKPVYSFFIGRFSVFYPNRLTLRTRWSYVHIKQIQVSQDFQINGFPTFLQTYFFHFIYPLYGSDWVLKYKIENWLRNVLSFRLGEPFWSDKRTQSGTPNLVLLPCLELWEPVDQVGFRDEMGWEGRVVENTWKRKETKGALDSVFYHPAGYRICWIVEKIRPG